MSHSITASILSNHDHWWLSNSPRTALVSEHAESWISHAIGAYTPEDETTHELVLSLLGGAKVFMQPGEFHLPDSTAFVKALGSLLAKDANRITSGQEVLDGRWDKVVEETLLLIRCGFDNKHIAQSPFVGFTPYDVSGRTHAITQYVRTLTRRSKLDDPRWPGNLFAKYVNMFRRFCLDDEGVELIRAVALLPPESFSVEPKDSVWSEDLYQWVLKEAGPLGN